ncbi:MAG: hypothetical protein NT045_04575 [Candidatus Aureabacteria bacterium]|nr:hypothetical protein [Candidatus Auribacterota bacterium]
MRRSSVAAFFFGGNFLALALLAIVPRTGASGFLYDCAAIIAIFFVPGTALVLAFSKRERIPLFELLAFGFGTNVITLSAATTVIKLAGTSINRGLLLALMALCVWLALLMLLRRRRLPAIHWDLRIPLPLLCAAFVSFPTLYVFLGGYTSLGPRQHWLIEQVQEICDHIPDPVNPSITRNYIGPGMARTGDYLSLPRGSCRLSITNASVQPLAVHLNYLVAADTPGVLTMTVNGKTDSHPLPQPFFDKGKQVLFQNQAVVSRPLAIPPGECAVDILFRDRAGRNAPCTLLDATGLPPGQFNRAFNSNYRLVNFVLMYDIMETEDFVGNLLRKPYLYHSYGTPEMPGYAIQNPPLSYIFASFGYALMGRNMAAVNKVAFAILMAEFFAALYLMHIGLGKVSTAASTTLLAGTLSLATLVTMGISLHFMTHFMFLNFLLACFFMLKRRALPCIVLSLICCCSAWAGYYFCALALLCYAIAWREIRWPLRRLAVITLCMGAFVAVLLTVGRSRGVFSAWLDILLWENFRRFGHAHLYQAGSKLKFLAYCIPGTALLPLGLFLRRDKSAYFFLLFSGLYLATLLLAPSNEWKIHYLPTVCIPLMIAGGRGIAIMGTSGGKRGWLTAAILWLILAGAIGSLLYMFILGQRGTLI